MLSGERCLVTGGSGGIGRAVAVRLASRGARVAIVGRDRRRLAKALRALRAAGGQAGSRAYLALVGDVGDPAAVTAMVERCMTRFGGIDVLVTCAGTGEGTGLPRPVADLDLATWRRVLAANLDGVYLTNRAVVRVMMRAGRGRIVNLGSALTPYGLHGRAMAAAYASSKFAVVGFTRVLAHEAAAYGVWVDALHPGPVDTPLIRDTSLARPFGGTVAPDDFATALVDWLALQSDRLRVREARVLPVPVDRPEASRRGTRG